MIKSKGWLFVLPWSPEVIGGVNTVVVELCKEINKEGTFKPFILVDDWTANRPIVIEKNDYTEVHFRLREFSVKFDRALMGFILHLPYTLFALFRMFKRHNIKVINPHYPNLTSIYFALFKYLRLKAAFIISFHGSDLAEIKKTPDTLPLWEFILKRANQVVSCSKGMSTALNAVFSSVIKKSVFVHNGLSANFFKQSAEYSSQDNVVMPKNYILSVGTFEHQKGQEVLITAFSLIAAQFEDVDLVLVGRTASALTAYKLLVAKMNLLGRVHFYENIQPTQIGLFYKNAKVYVSSSKNESFGLVMLEAAAFYVPVVATRTIGACEIIEDNVDGKLVDIDDTEAIAKQLSFLLNDEVQCKKIARNLRNKARFVFTWEKALARYMSYI